LKAKVFGFLGRRGFSAEIAEAAFETAWEEREGPTTEK
jgi:SOS response regulatory protein OraA/RecX